MAEYRKARSSLRTPNEDEIEELVEQSKGDSIKKRHLSGRFAHQKIKFWRLDFQKYHSSAEPLIKYLKDGEQPHYLLYNFESGLIRDNEAIKKSEDHLNLLLVTDEALIFIVGDSSDDRCESVQYDRIMYINIQYNKSDSYFIVESAENSYRFHIDEPSNQEEKLECFNYIKSNLEKSWIEIENRYQHIKQELKSKNSSLAKMIPSFEEISEKESTVRSASNLLDEFQELSEGYSLYSEGKKKIKLMSKNMDVDTDRICIRDISSYDSAQEFRKDLDTFQSWVELYEKYYRLSTRKLPKLDLEDLSGVGSVKAEALRDVGIESVQDIQHADVKELKAAQGIGRKHARQIKDEVKEWTSTEYDEVIAEVPEQADQLFNQYSPEGRSLSEARVAFNDLVQWLDLYDRYVQLQKRGEDYLKGATLAELELSGVGPAKVDSLSEVGIETVSDVRESGVDGLKKADGVGDYLAEQIHSKVGDIPSPSVNEVHLESLISNCSPGYDSYREGETQLDELEAWIEVYERYRECYITGLELEPEYEVWVKPVSGYEFDVSLEEYHPSLFDSVEEAEDKIGILEGCFEILEFLSEVDHQHPSVEASLWCDAVKTAFKNQDSQIIDPINAQISRMKNAVWEADDLFNFGWDEFEHLVGDLYQDQGYEIEVTQSSADLGVDIWATKGSECVAIQVKQFQDGNTVGRETLQKLASTLAKNEADQAVVVTSSRFARTAEQYAEDFGPGLELVDQEDLVKRLTESKIPPPK